MKEIRKSIIVWLFKNSQTIYTKYFKKDKSAWKVTLEGLSEYQDASLGKKLHDFLTENQFELLPKLERHDCYHVITQYKSKAEDEIALQYLCFGNGKRTPYLFLVVIIGTLLLPDYLKYYIHSYKIGKNANLFHNLDYEKLLHVEVELLQSIFFNTRTVNLNNISS